MNVGKEPLGWPLLRLGDSPRLPVLGYGRQPSSFGSDVEMPHGLFDDEQAIESLAVVFLIDQFLFGHLDDRRAGVSTFAEMCTTPSQRAQGPRPQRPPEQNGLCPRPIRAAIMAKVRERE